LRREVEQVGIETQAGDDTDMVADRGKEFDGCKRTVGNQNDIAIGGNYSPLCDAVTRV
jgi:hypothetical protein